MRVKATPRAVRGVGEERVLRHRGRNNRLVPMVAAIRLEKGADFCK
jgi:hypothetical protein